MTRRIFIYGSCVSRDSFEYDETGRFEIVDYFSRSSLASAFSSPAVPDRWSAKLNSAFQKRQVERDFTKALPDALAQGRYDILLTDFIDERFRIFAMKSGGVVTVSAEPNSLRVLDPSLGRMIATDSPERFDLWCKGWTRMTQDLEARGQLDRLVVNQMFWAPTGQTMHDNIRDRMNECLQTMYDHCRKTLPSRNFISYDPKLFVADPDHKWGLAPFHYRPALYHETLRQLDLIAAPPAR